MSAVFPFHSFELKSALWELPLSFDLGESRLPRPSTSRCTSLYPFSSQAAVLSLMKGEFSDLSIPPLCPPPADDLQSTSTAL